jgi:pyruvate,water dikinase
MPTLDPWVLRFDELVAADVPRVGGKNASLGEMIRELAGAGVPVPPGFATTAHAYRAFVAENRLGPVIAREIAALHAGTRAPRDVGASIRAAFRAGRLPDPMRATVLEAYRALGAPAVAVRSSATAEDLPTASFAGQQDTFLNVAGRGAAPARRLAAPAYASLFTDRAIAYRDRQRLRPPRRSRSRSASKRMARAIAGSRRRASSRSTPRPASPTSCIINAAWGLGENVVKGHGRSRRAPRSSNRCHRAPPRRIIAPSSRLRRQGADDDGRSQSARCSTRTVDVPPDTARALRARGRRDAITLARGGAMRSRNTTQKARRPTCRRWTSSGPRTARPAPSTFVQARPETGALAARRRARRARHLHLVEAPPPPSIVARSQRRRLAIVAGPRLRDATRPEDLASFADWQRSSSTEITDPDWVPLMRQRRGRGHRSRRPHLPCRDPQPRARHPRRRRRGRRDDQTPPHERRRGHPLLRQRR